jgi:hypothetical protein
MSVIAPTFLFSSGQMKRRKFSQGNGFLIRFHAVSEGEFLRPLAACDNMKEMDLQPIEVKSVLLPRALAFEIHFSFPLNPSSLHYIGPFMTTDKCA